MDKQIRLTDLLTDFLYCPGTFVICLDQALIRYSFALIPQTFDLFDLFCLLIIYVAG